MNKFERHWMRNFKSVNNISDLSKACSPDDATIQHNTELFDYRKVEHYPVGMVVYKGDVAKFNFRKQNSIKYEHPYGLDVITEYNDVLKLIEVKEVSVNCLSSINHSKNSLIRDNYFDINLREVKVSKFVPVINSLDTYFADTMEKCYETYLVYKGSYNSKDSTLDNMYLFMDFNRIKNPIDIIFIRTLILNKVAMFSERTLLLNFKRYRDEYLNESIISNIPNLGFILSRDDLYKVLSDKLVKEDGSRNESLENFNIDLRSKNKGKLFKKASPMSFNGELYRGKLEHYFSEDNGCS